MHQDHYDDPIRVRVVSNDAYEYDTTPEGQARLAFDAWVMRIMIALYVLGSILY